MIAAPVSDGTTARSRRSAPRARAVRSQPDQGGVQSIVMALESRREPSTSRAVAR